MTPDLQQLKAEEVAEESRRAKPNNSSAITEMDRRNLELAKRSARDIPTKEQVIAICEKMGMYSPMTANYLRGGGIPGYDPSAERSENETAS